MHAILQQPLFTSQSTSQNLLYRHASRPSYARIHACRWSAAGGDTWGEEEEAEAAAADNDSKGNAAAGGAAAAPAVGGGGKWKHDMFEEMLRREAAGISGVSRMGVRGGQEVRVECFLCVHVCIVCIVSWAAASLPTCVHIVQQLRAVQPHCRLRDLQVTRTSERNG